MNRPRELDFLRMIILRRFKRAHILIVTYIVVFIIFVILFLDTGSGIVEGWPPNQSRDVKKYLFKGNELDIAVLPREFCKNTVFLLTLVTSSPKNHDHRSAVRETYGSKKTLYNEEVSLYFIVGSSTQEDLQESILEESSLYGDMIIGNFIDSYNNLTLKTVFLLGLVDLYCQNTTTFILKTDDDVYVNIDLLVPDLRTKFSDLNQIMGHVYHNPGKITNTRDKWFMPDYMFPGKQYPDFVSGTGYVIPVDIVPKLYTTALNTPYIHLEDVFVTGICAAKSNVTLHPSDKFAYGKRISVCAIRNYYTVHWEKRLTPLQLFQIHELLNSKEALEDCDKPSYSVLSWFFNVFH